MPATLMRRFARHICFALLQVFKLKNISVWKKKHTWVCLSRFVFFSVLPWLCLCLFSHATSSISCSDLLFVAGMVRTKPYFLPSYRNYCFIIPRKIDTWRPSCENISSFRFFLLLLLLLLLLIIFFFFLFMFCLFCT